MNNQKDTDEESKWFSKNIRPLGSIKYMRVINTRCIDTAFKIYHRLSIFYL